MFKHFQVLYGHKFVSMYDGIEDFAAKQWAASLKGITGEQIKNGLRKCGDRKIKSGEADWPPTPAEFRAMCLPERVEMIHRDYIPLPKPPQDIYSISLHISEMRKTLRGY